MPDVSAQSVADATQTLPTPNPARETIRLQGVGYEYPERQGSALEDIDLELTPGEITALLGPSGAGKSTIAKLVMRLADPTRGQITCAGVDLRDLDPERWREQIAWVPQRAQIFSGTVAENIRLGIPHADEAQVERAARAVGAIEFIEDLPFGMHTPIGEAARRLSAGQRQRIALARAFLRDARLLVLDGRPPTSTRRTRTRSLMRSLDSPRVAPRC